MKQDFLKFPFHLIFHPFDGYWDLKYEGKGRMKVALSILLMLVAAIIIMRQYSGFLVNFADPRSFNSLNEMLYVLIPFALWTVSNWSLTTLMDGEGTFRNIVMATAYALLPMILIFLPSTLISNFMTPQETSFYYLFHTVAVIWFVWLLFIGTMTVHQFTVSKTLITMALTVVVMGIIIFLGLLFINLVQQMTDFVFNLYKEYTLRN
ncbi:Yip1 family protein [Paenibacillus sp. GCM10027626]|uniref:Yip1 family protein n=1 Tax=Paenibacillus sp. GCM10027626 TaxID=3273411 RepID=UPI0036408516